MLDTDRLPTLTAERVKLRWLTDDDTEAIYSIFSDHDVTRYWSTPPMTSTTQAERLVNSVHQLFREHRLYQWGLTLHDSDEVIGTCTLAELNAQNRRAEIGFALARPYWQGGLMSDGLRTLLAFAFTELKLHRIEADVDPRNEASIGLLNRLGFDREGYMRERWIVNGEICDTAFFGLLEKDWLAAQST